MWQPDGGHVKDCLKRESLWRFTFKFQSCRNKINAVVPRHTQPLTETNELSSLATAAAMPPRCVGLSWPV